MSRTLQRCPTPNVAAERWFVLTRFELRWYDKVQDFENQFPPEKVVHTQEITIEDHSATEGSDK